MADDNTPDQMAPSATPGSVVDMRPPMGPPAPPQQDVQANPNVAGAQQTLPANVAQGPQQQTPVQGQSQAAISQKPLLEQDHQTLFHTLFQSLAGGPKTSYKINADTGAMEKTETPMGKGGIMAGILAGAVTGMLKSSQNRGQNATGMSQFATGAEATMDKQAQQTAQGKKEATEEYKRSQDVQAQKLSTLDTNLKMHAIAVGLGQKGQEANQANVDSHAGTFDLISKNNPEAILADMVPHDQLLSKYNVTDSMAIPRKVVARMDTATGKQAEDAYGTPLWDTLYAVVKPDAVAPLNKDVLAKAAYWSQPGTVNSSGAPINSAEGTALKIQTQLAMQARNSSLDSMQQDLKTSNPNVDLAAEIKKDPSLADAIGKFQGSLAHGGDTLAGIDEVKKKDTAAGMKLEELFGGRQKLIADEAAKKQADLERTEATKGRNSAEAYAQKLQLKADADKEKNAELFTPEGLDTAALKALKDGKPPSGRSVQANAMIYNRMAEIAAGTGRPIANVPDVAGNMQKYVSNQSSRNKLQTNADTINAFEGTAGKNLDLFLQTAQHLVDVGSPLLNKPLREITQAMGGTDYPAVLAARETAMTEIAKVLNSANASGVLGEQSKKDILELTKPGATFGQIVSASKVLKQDMANRKTETQRALQEIDDRASKIGRAGGLLKVSDQQPIESNAPQGATVEYKDANGVVKGHAINGKYVPVQ